MSPFSRAYFALLRRNLIYRKRNIMGTLLEILLPFAFLYILVAIKGVAEGTTGFSPKVVKSTKPTDSQAIIPLSFRDYVVGLQANRTCVENWGARGGLMISDYYDNQNPFLKCDWRNCNSPGESAENFCEYNIIAIAPKEKTDSKSRSFQRASKFREYLYRKFPELRTVEAKTQYELVNFFDSSSQIEEYVTDMKYGTSLEKPKVGFAIVFMDGESEDDFSYALRANSTNYNQPDKRVEPGVSTSPPTDVQFCSLCNEDNACQNNINQGRHSNSCTGQYLYNGAITMQRVLQDWIYAEKTDNDDILVAEHGVKFVSFPTKEFTTRGFYAQMNAFAPLMVLLSLMYPLVVIIRDIVAEKQLRQKELLKMMSVKESDIEFSWYTSFFILHIITSLCSSKASVELYEDSEYSVFFTFWLLSFAAFISFSLFIATFFSNSSRATLVGIIIIFIGYILSLIDVSTSRAKMILSLHPTAGIAFLMQEMGRLADAGAGVNWGTINSGLADNATNFSLLSGFSYMIICTIFWYALAWYCNRVIRSDYGQPYPWNFLFTKEYWFSSDLIWEQINQEEFNAIPEGIPIEEAGESADAAIREGRGIAIHNLSKTFGKKRAVDGLTLTMYPNQVTALLGHNGAGKTTTINMLTGMLPPTGGYALVDGNDIRHNMNEIRQDLGICLQHDCLFPNLTVEEHIEFFSRLKGLYSRTTVAEAREKVKQYIVDVALLEKRHTLSKDLSGGMKRKLSVAIAFCGDSKTVLLDEPTSGMDPFSRRFTWDVIRQYRKDRTIILTTHFMDEADILGDRIAIMGGGRLRCAGSSLFLKKEYGVGYQLTIEKYPKINGDPSKEQNEIEEKLIKIVESSVAEAKLLSNVGTQLSFQLPIQASSQFKSMFNHLDHEVDEKKIVTYGVSITTLDEVFLIVAKGEIEEHTESRNSEVMASARYNSEEVPERLRVNQEPRSIQPRMPLEDEDRFRRHISALLRKRALNFKRDKKAWFCSTILPACLVLFGFMLLKLNQRNVAVEPLTLSIESLNPELELNHIPIPFNKPGNSFTCEPGRCLMDFTGAYSQYEEYTTTQNFSFCGANFYGENEYACSISDSEDIINRVTETGAKGVPQVSLNVNESSYNLEADAKKYKASFYGTLLFAHDKSSKIQGNTIDEYYSNNVVRRCEEFTEREMPSFFNKPYCQDYDGIGYVVQYNYTSIHASLLYQAVADEALMREKLGDDKLKISSSVHPLPLTDNEVAVTKSMSALNGWFMIVLAFPFVLGSYATFIVSERASKAKHLQTVAGVQPSAYWISSFLWDFLNYQLPLWSTVIMMFVFNVEALTTTERGAIGGVITSFLLFGPASAGFTYCFTFLFTSASKCNLFVIIMNFLLGFVGTIVIFILRIIGKQPMIQNASSINLAADIIQRILHFFPSFNLANALWKIMNIKIYETFSLKKITVWDSSAIMWETISQSICCVAYIILAIQIDKWSNNPRIVSYFQGCRKKVLVDAINSDNITDDEDVTMENERISSGEASNDLIILNRIGKVYGSGKVAVKELSLGIPPGQCFGLLGTNGAGKTTTIGMLTAEYPPTTGDASLAGFSVALQPEKTRSCVGYCPQFDAHFSNMTGKEHVALYATIKGLPDDLIKKAVDAKLAEVGLSESDSERLSSEYSGGMKRKLSVACATIGQPQIVFLDEPSTGMDPVSRRDLWAVISNMVTCEGVAEGERTSVILTTHSMEECEALCPRIAIMANGKIRCLGSAQHLKTRYGRGYQVELKTKLVESTDKDYTEIRNKLAFTVKCSTGSDTNDNCADNGDEEEIERRLIDLETISFFNLREIQTALQSLPSGESLYGKLTAGDPQGLLISKNLASGIGCSLEELTHFATFEIRMQNIDNFLKESFRVSIILRERQNNKVRYEISSSGDSIKISNIFEQVENAKEMLMLSEYSVSQTSLEQVFNMHAAEAEKAKLDNHSLGLEGLT